MLLKHELVGQLLIDASVDHGYSAATNAWRVDRLPIAALVLVGTLQDLLSSGRGLCCLVCQRQVRTSIELRLVRVVGMHGAASPFYPFDFLAVVRVLAACPVVLGTGAVDVEAPVPVSQVRLLHVAAALSGVLVRYALALSLRLANAELLRDEAVLDDLVDVLFPRERSLVIEIKVAHLLADVRLVHTLRVVPTEAVADETRSYEASVDSARVRRSRSLLVSARLNLVFAQQDAFPMDLLERDVRLRQVVVANGVLVQSVYRRVCRRASLVKRLLRHDALTDFLGAVL